MTERNLLISILAWLDRQERVLSDHLMDAQEAAEDRGEVSPGFFTGDNNDVPICVPEDAAPDLDAARHALWECAQQFRELLHVPDDTTELGESNDI